MNLFHPFHLTRSSPQGLIAPLKGQVTPDSTICGLGLARLQVLHLPTLRLERVLGNLILRAHLVAVHQKLLDDVCKLRVLVQRFCSLSGGGGQRRKEAEG